MRLAYALGATAMAAALCATPACTRVVTGSPIRGAGAPVTPANGCASVSAPLTSIESHTAAEPQLKIPQPLGWERTSKLDSDVIRFTMGNKAFSAMNFMPTAVVTLESMPGREADYKTIFEQERGALSDRLGATGLHTTETTLCGDRAELVDYDAPSMGRIPPRKAKTLMVTGTFSGDTYVATVTVQATNPTNSGYVRDTDTILTGFQMLPPDGG